MKKSILAALAAVVLCAASTRARAEDGKQDKDGDQKSNAEWTAKMKMHMKESLNLTDEQSAQVDALMKSSREKMKPLRERSHAADRKLAAIVSAGTDAEVEAALKEADSARKALDEQRRNFETTLASILKPRQLAKMLVERQRRMRRDWRMEDRGDGHGQRDCERTGRKHADREDDAEGPAGRWRGNDEEGN